MYRAINNYEHGLHIPWHMICELSSAGNVRYHKADQPVEHDDLATSIVLFGGAVLVLPSGSYIELTDESMVVCWPIAAKSAKA